MKKRIAVTGATGFIGRHVIAALVRRGLDVVAVTRRGAQDTGFSSPIISVVTLDINNPPPDAYELLRKPDILIHLAWGGLPNYQSLSHFEEELPSHYEFIKSLVESGLKNLVAAGTCLEYGMQPGPLSETCPARPTTPYGYAKNCLREQLQYMQKSQSFNFTWARLFYLYGEGQGQNSLYSQLKSAIASGKGIFDMSQGEQLRDYMAVSDAAEILVKLALKREDIHIVNLCSGRPVSVRSLVERWLKELGRPLKLNLGCFPYPDYEALAFWGGRDKLERLLEQS